MKIEEQISQFLDGEMESAQSASLVKQLRDQDAKQAWSRYHMIGDAMRGELTDVLSLGLAERVSAVLDNEPNLFAPNALQEAGQSEFKPADQVATTTEKHSPRFAWAFGLAASMALVGVLGIQIGQQQTKTGLSSISIAQAPAPTITTTQQPRISLVAGIDRPVVKPMPPTVLAEQNPVPQGHWKRLDLNRPEFSPYLQPSTEFSVVPGMVPSRPMAQVASFGENRAQ